MPKLKIYILVVSALFVWVCACQTNSDSIRIGDTDHERDMDGDRDFESGELETDESGPADFADSRPLTKWRIKSTKGLDGDGARLSRFGYDDSGWLAASVPGTVLGAQVDAGLMGDPYFGDNLKEIDGWTLSFLPMPQDSPYRNAWWYRSEFEPPIKHEAARHWLIFEGINYEANVWFNGHIIAGIEDVVGTFRRFRFDVTDRLTYDHNNAVALEVFAPDMAEDLAIFWVDWNPMPPDYNMGLWMPAEMKRSGPVILEHPAVLTSLSADGSADLVVLVEMQNASEHEQAVTLEGRFSDIVFSHSATLSAGERREIVLGPQDIPQLRLKTPRLWWPYQYGEPFLYEMKLTASVNGEISDRSDFDFGIREVTAELDQNRSLKFSINGKPILIRGAGWAPDMLYRDDEQRDSHELAYVKDMGLNTIRLEGKFEPQRFYEACDREGILLMPGWCCCDQWENWDDWTESTRTIAKASLENQLRRLRRHPSVLTWLNGSDFHPPSDIERMYLEVAEAAHWNLPIVSNATETPSDVTGPSGLKMTGPYHWVPPDYWYRAVPEDPSDLFGNIDWEWMFGGAFGFNSESSPGPSIPPIESLRRMMPEEDIWPISQTFLFHSGGFSTAADRIAYFMKALEARHGEPTNAEDFAYKAQLMNYESHRAMFEAQARNKYFATGHIQWMLNNAWPGTIWQLYDYFLRPGGSYFGTKKALRPVHVQYAYDDKGVYVINSTLKNLAELRVTAKLFALDSTEIVEKYATIETLEGDGKSMALSLADDIAANIETLAPVYFLDLTLANESGTTMDRNVYWLAAQPDSYEMLSSEDNRPNVTYADFTSLNALPLASVTVSDPTLAAGDSETQISVTLENTSGRIAFFLECLLVDGPNGHPLLPVIWDDNYISLLPGEARSLNARIPSETAISEAPRVMIRGFNLAM